MIRRKFAVWCAVALAAGVLAAGVLAAGVLAAGCGTVSGSAPTSGQTQARTPTANSSPVASATAGSSSFWPLSLSMTSGTAGWALYDAQNPAGVQSQPTLLARTVDGGRSWVDVTPPAARSLLAAKFATAVIDPVDSEHAYLAVTGATQVTSAAPTPAAVFATADGGKTWTESPPFMVDSPIIQVVFADARNGWLLTGAGESAAGKPLPWLYRTTDGGLHWTPAASAPPPGEGGPNDMCLLRAVTFATAKTGWVLVSCRSGEYLAKSTDGGSTWAVQSLPAVRACARLADQCVLFGPQLSQGIAYLTVTATQGNPTPSLLATGNLGQSWHQLPLPAGSEQYPEVTFFGAADGVLVTMGPQQALGTVFYTTADGGQSWAAVPQGTHFTQLGAAIDFVTPQVGFSWTQAEDTQASTPPPLYATTNTGLTWTSFTPEVTG